MLKPKCKCDTYDPKQIKQDANIQIKTQTDDYTRTLTN